MSNADVASRLFAAIEAGDIDAVRALYAPGAIVWHNYDRVAQTREENLRVLAWLARRTAKRAYTQRRLFETSDGFVQTHVLVLGLPSGATLEVPACIVATVRGGRIERIDEYLDPAQVAELSR